jgi:general stress protein YciG
MNKKQRKEFAQVGGRAVSKDREHMAEIGRAGAAARWGKKKVVKSKKK